MASFSDVDDEDFCLLDNQPLEFYPEIGDVVGTPAPAPHITDLHTNAIGAAKDTNARGIAWDHVGPSSDGSFASLLSPGLLGNYTTSIV